MYETRHLPSFMHYGPFRQDVLRRVLLQKVLNFILQKFLFSTLRFSYKFLHKGYHDPLHHWQPVRNCETANCLEKESPQPNLAGLYQLKVTDRSCRRTVCKEREHHFLIELAVDWHIKMHGKAAKAHRSSAFFMFLTCYDVHPSDIL